MFASYSAVESALLATAVAFATHWACAKFNYGAGGLTGVLLYRCQVLICKF